MSSEDAKVARSGAVTTSSGERHIPSSTRPDGSVRKEIRIRPGYRPPEDVDLYKSRNAQAWRDRGKGGAPGAVPGADTADSKPQGQSTAANKNAKRREARKKAAAAVSGEGTDGDKTEPTLDGEASSAATAAAPTEPNASKTADPEAEKEREAKKLAKKLRQARELKDKKDKGDALLPEQFEKVIRINELIRQLDNLGFDSNGDKKEQETEAT